MITNKRVELNLWGLLFLSIMFLSDCSDEKIEFKYKHLHNNCFILKPVINPSALDDPIDIQPVSSESYSKLIAKIEEGEKQIDTLMEYITGYSHQKVISLSHVCFQKLNYPDSTFVKEIFLNSMPNSNAIVGSLEYLNSYKKDILKFGPSIVFEYRLNEVVEAAPQNIVLVFKDYPNRLKKDYKGYAFCSNGVKWIDVGSGKSVFVFIDKVRRNKEYEILTFFDDERFVPLAHKKIGEW